MIQIEQNVMNSFRLAKRDIIRMQSEIIRLRESQEELIKKLASSESDKRLSTVESNNRWLINKIGEERKTSISHISCLRAPSRRKTYVGSKKGKRFHMLKCPFAQNIKPKTKIIFKTKAKAFNKGYKPCSCIR